MSDWTMLAFDAAFMIAGGVLGHGIGYANGQILVYKKWNKRLDELIDGAGTLEDRP